MMRAFVRRAGWRHAFLMAIVVLLLAAPGHAMAGSSVSVSSGIAYFNDDWASAQSLLVTSAGGGSFIFSSSSTTITAGAGCVQDAPDQVTCGGITRMSFYLGDMADSLSSPAVVPTYISGGSGSDTLGATSGTASVVVDAGAGNDLVYTGNGADEVDGGEGDDNIGVFAGENEARGGPGDDTIAGQGSSDRIFGDDGNDEVATTGSGWLYGGTGDDELTSIAGPAESISMFGGPGADIFDGGESDDQVFYSERTTAVSVSNDGVANDGAAGEMDLVDAEVDAVWLGSGNDRGVGFPFIDGSKGNDTLLGRATATSELRGGAGDDYLRGGTAGDQLHGDTGRDVLDYTNHSVGVVVDLNSFGGDGSPGENDILTNFETFLGTNARDVFTGTASAERFVTRGGNDKVLAGDGADTLDGGTGKDELRAQAGADTLLARDGFVDTADGGSGSDRARVDRVPAQKVSDIRISLETLLA